MEENLNQKSKMKKKREIKQGEIYMCNLDGVDNEQKGIHPVLIVSVNILNKTSNNVVVFPITHRNKKYMPFHYKLYKENYPFFTYKENLVQPELVRCISKNKLERYLGIIFAKDMIEILKNKDYVFIEKIKGGNNGR